MAAVFGDFFAFAAIIVQTPHVSIGKEKYTAIVHYIQVGIGVLGRNLAYAPIDIVEIDLDIQFALGFLEFKVAVLPVILFTESYCVKAFAIPVTLEK